MAGRAFEAFPLGGGALRSRLRGPHLGAMKHYFFIFCFLWTAAFRAQPPNAGVGVGVSAGATSPGIQALDAKNGFRGYTLGEPIANYPNLKRRGADMYEARTELLKPGDVRLFMLLFGAEGERLTSINLVALGNANAT